MIRRIRGRTLAPLMAAVAVAGMVLVSYVGLGAVRQPAAAVGDATAPGDSARLLTFGHSYVAGLGASRPDKAWPSLVATGTCRSLVNHAGSGDISAETTISALTAAGDLRPTDVAVVETGINDVRLFGPDAGLLDRYGQHVKGLLSSLQATGSTIPVVLVADPGIAPWAWAAYAPYNKGSQAVADAYVQKLKSVAAAFPNATVVDVRDTWSTADIAGDGLHPNDKGHTLIADAVRSVLRSRGANRCQDVTQVQVVGPDLVEQPYVSVRFAAELTPEPTSLKEVVWSVTEPDGSPTDKAAISKEGMLTVNHRDGDVLVTATAADGGGAHGSKLVRIALDAGLLRGNAVRWPTVSVTVSSVYNSDFGAEKLRDGIPGGEWASAGQQNPWVRVDWQRPVRVDKIVLYDRAGIDDVNGGTLTFSDGSTVSVADVPRNGDPKTVSFDIKTFTWVRFQVQGGSGPNVGLAEFEVYALPAPPDAPTQVSASAGQGTATVSWRSPAFDGGTPLTGYVVTPYRDGTALAPTTVAETATQVVVPGLSPGQSYRFTVRATNMVGAGAESAPSEPVTPA
jgi:lysophospholipase L1-like esterase